VFLAIPIVMCFFSYLFAVAVLLGVLTRSTIATLLLTILFWAMAFAVYFGEVRLQAFINIGERRIGLINNDLAELAKSKPTTSKTTINAFASAADMLGVKFKRDPREIERDNLITRRDRIASNLQSLRTWHRVAAPLHLLSPKTTETTDSQPLADHRMSFFQSWRTSGRTSRPDTEIACRVGSALSG
jgi:hypothetical protein